MSFKNCIWENKRKKTKQFKVHFTTSKNSRFKGNSDIGGPPKMTITRKQQNQYEQYEPFYMSQKCRPVSSSSKRMKMILTHWSKVSPSDMGQH